MEMSGKSRMLAEGIKNLFLTMGVWLLGRCSGQQLCQRWDLFRLQLCSSAFSPNLSACPVWGGSPRAKADEAGGSPASVMLRVGEDSVYGGDIEDQGHRRGAPAGS